MVRVPAVIVCVSGFSSFCNTTAVVTAAPPKARAIRIHFFLLLLCGVFDVSAGRSDWGGRK